MATEPWERETVFTCPYTFKFRTRPLMGTASGMAKAGTCARDRRALQRLVLNVHVKHSDLT